MESGKAQHDKKGKLWAQKLPVKIHLDEHSVFEPANWFAGSVIQVALLETHCNMVWKVEM